MVLYMFLETCNETDCGFYSECVPSFSAQSQCVCPVCNERLEQSYQPVCAVNGYSYATECLLKRHSCVQQKILSVVDKDACGND